ncbi:hypothetical protein C1929_16970 [Stenotrophomonas sp. ZAC14D1_NAIMI4_6]|nr:hypothetical protein C1929_16970 [Stenotrophomonas sp. ZAC14D1_NAIMI4_6]AWH42465.1 hypothetical protein C1927_16970 [Stenotrophomonas sp. ZAC14D1_NAIMI4_1]
MWTGLMTVASTGLGGSAGLRPAPAVVPAAGRQLQQQRQKLVSWGMAGWVQWRGTLQVRPCKLGRRIHAAHAPATGPTPPSTVSRGLSERRFALVGVDLGRHIHEMIENDLCSVEPCSTTAKREARSAAEHGLGATGIRPRRSARRCRSSG